MKATCEDVAELGLEIVAKRQEIRQMQAQMERERADWAESAESYRAQIDYLEDALTGAREAQHEAERAERAAESVKAELRGSRRAADDLRDEVERRKKQYQELERHVLLWLKPGDELELCVACVGLAGDMACELPAGHRVRVVSEPGLSYQVKCEGAHPSGQPNMPAVSLKVPLHEVRLVSKQGDGGALDLSASVAHLQEVIDQLTVAIDMGAGVHGPAKEMREIVQAVQQAAGQALGDLRRGGRCGI